MYRDSSFAYSGKVTEVFFLVWQESNLKLNTVLDETSARLQEALNNKDKLAQNFDETEKLYLEKIKSLQEDLVSAQQEKDNQSKR